MRTSRNISTISYNTDEFLKIKLDELIRGKIITFYMFVNHKGEADECRGKSHKHLFIMPAKMIQSDDLIQELREPDPENEKPKTVRPFEYSKVDDWLLYAIHDKHYLAIKGQSREYHYQWSDIYASDEDYKEILIQRINVEITPYDKIQSARAAGQNVYQFLTSGQVPIRDIRYYKEAWEAFEYIAKYKDELNRNGRKGHEEYTAVCSKCGEYYPFDELEEIYTDSRGIVKGICKDCKSKLSDK